MNENKTESNSEGSGGNRIARDEKRRATHNEVERRRRDKINNWIIKLSKVVPDCQQDHTKQVQLFYYSIDILDSTETLF